MIENYGCTSSSFSEGESINYYMDLENSRTLYLVRFENESKELGPPVGCWEEELTDEPELAGEEAG